MTSRSLNNPSRLIVGCGYLGQRVARRWIQSGSTVFAITRSPANAEMLSAENIHPIIGDVTAADGSPKSLRDLPEVDTVLWSVGFDRSADASYHDVHVTGLRVCIEAQRLVILDSETRALGHVRLEQLSAPVTMVRPHKDLHEIM